MIPKVKAAMASLRRDLRDLLAMQAAFQAEHGGYTESLGELDFLPASSNYAAGKNGFAAAGRSDEFDGFGVRVGDTAGQFEGQPEGELFLLGAK